MTEEIKRIFKFRDAEALQLFLGTDDSTLRFVRRHRVRAQVTGRKLVLKGTSPQDLVLASEIVSFISLRAHQGQSTTPQALESYMNNQSRRSTPGSIAPKTEGQGIYLSCLNDNDVVFGLGPAGTGKTFLAVAVAVKALQEGVVKKLVLTRPAVEAGEHLGFLPGTFAEKVDPYLQPLTDSLNKLLGNGVVERFRKEGKIEVAPLAYMRGRTLENAYVILDEAQNCTRVQLVMLLTRLGEGSKAVLTGDISQTDLMVGQSGLKSIVEDLQGVEGIGFHEFGACDVVRHPLVARIIEALANKGSVNPVL